MIFHQLDMLVGIFPIETLHGGLPTVASSEFYLLGNNAAEKDPNVRSTK